MPAPCRVAPVLPAIRTSWSPALCVPEVLPSRKASPWPRHHCPAFQILPPVHPVWNSALPPRPLWAGAAEGWELCRHLRSGGPRGHLTDPSVLGRHSRTGLQVHQLGWGDGCLWVPRAHSWVGVVPAGRRACRQSGLGLPASRSPGSGCPKGRPSLARSVLAGLSLWVTDAPSTDSNPAAE